MSHNRLIIAALGVAVTLASCGGGSPPDPLEVGDPELGREVFTREIEDVFTGGTSFTTACSACHLLVPDENTTRAPSLAGISEGASERVRGQSAVEYLRESIVDPTAYIVKGNWIASMPRRYGDVLSEDDINNLIAFLLTQ